ncbi:MAG: oxidoreductase [Nitrospiria bacterium]
MIAVICGATGLTGSILVGKLLTDPEISQLISVSRKSLDIKSPKLKEIIISHLSELPNYHSQLRGDMYFCCLGTTLKEAGSREKFKQVDYDAVLEFGKIANAHCCYSFVLISSIGANSNSLFFYNRIKGEVELALQKLSFKSLIIFRPGFLIGNRKNFRRGERMFVEVFRWVSPFFPSIMRKRVMTHAQELAERMVLEGKNPRPGVLILESHKI